MALFNKESEADKTARLAREEEQARSLAALETGKLPTQAQRRLSGQAGGSGFFTSDLSTDEHLLVRQAGLDPSGGSPGPAQEQIPGAQPQMLRDEQPNAHLVAGDFVGQQLAHLPLQTPGIGRSQMELAAGPLRRHVLRRVGRVKRVEFFFAGRSRR